MEIVPYLLSVLVSVLVFHWSWVNAKRKPDQPVRGLFTYAEEKAPPAAVAPEAVRRGPAGRRRAR